MKRAGDIVLAIVGLLLTWPIIVVCAVAVRLTSPGPAIFRQTRVGYKERPFICLKLRTMYQGTGDAPTHQTVASSVTPLGHHLRRLKLDELPQLWNVLVGEMSFVGPRPCLPSQTELIAERRRLGVYGLRPGITGVAQVRGIDMSDPQRLAAVDATYLGTDSLVTDIRLIWITIRGGGRGDRVRNG
jgi:O-antigen biosynthesis protein WbqP